VFEHGPHQLLDAAISVYEATLHCSIDRRRVFLYNALCALTYLADRAGTAPGDRPCGRTLPEDLQWSKHAIAVTLDALA
jgi:hypothetical protein